MKINIIGDGSAGARHARILRAKGHICTVLGPDRASPVLHPECEAVVIASPPETHKLYLSWYWDKCPILCEGPITWINKYRLTYPHMVAENWIWVPPIRELKGKINQPVTMAHFFFDYDLAKWRPDIDYRTTCYWTSGIDMINLHNVSLAFYFFGSAETIHVAKQQSGKSLGYDTVGLLIHHRSGTISTVNSSWHSSVFRFGFNMTLQDGSYHEMGWTSPKDDAVANVSYEAQIDAWLSNILEKSMYPEPNLVDGYRAYKALQGDVV